MSWVREWLERRDCFHHDHNTGESWIAQELLDLGRTKRLWCIVCGKMWFV